MYLEKILLKNYRNLKESLLELNSNLNILVGYNGQGKTNFLESIYLLGTGSSHRTGLDRELINWEEEKALIQVLLVRKDQNLKISILLDGSQKKIEINNTPIERVSELIGNLNVVLFSPEDLNLVKGGPANRRRFLDVEVSQVSSYYYYLLHKYNHVLKQRNNLLKDIRDGKGNKELLEIWDEKLVELGSKVILKRMEVVEKLKILARLTQRRITNGVENLVIDYQPGLKGEIDRERVSLIFKQDLVNNRKIELERGYTLVGPHRDDLVFKINGVDVRKYGSQGQQRTTALALKLAELEFMKSETGEYPILLLDDVFSELDELRRSTLLRLIADKIQTFITATDLNNLKGINEGSFHIFRVEEGEIYKEG
ncbi:MAG: replication and repair protein RecF [Halanaerobiales bacterium]|nr:replication and repair protein RecF [Halanaerobiales bacterium]